MGKNESEWTDDFSKFRAKVEPIFGKLEILAEEAPAAYEHLVLSHGFMEYSCIRGIHEGIISKIKLEKGSYDSTNSNHKKLSEQYLKEEYLNWARQNNLPENLLEKGWIEFLND